MHQIENQFLKVRAREYGAELISIYDKKNNIERLWQADEAIWGWHAPVLFPVVGRCLQDEITVNSVRYPLGKHGFARKSYFRLLELSDTKMVFSLQSGFDTEKVYPYKFEFLIAYHVKGNELIVSYEVINKDTGAIYFSVGGHPAFNAPIQTGEKYEDYYLEFEQNETSQRYLINTEGFFDGRKEPVLNNSNIIPLKTDMFKDDAFIFKDLKSRRVTLKSKNHAHYLSMDYTGFNYLGLWAKVNAPYVCIEPWLGCADTEGNPVDFKQKEGIIQLETGKEFRVSYAIEVG